MKLAFFDDYKLGVVVGDKIVDVSAVVKDIPRAWAAGRHPRRDRAVRQAQGQARRRGRQEGQGQAAVEGQAPAAAAAGPRTSSAWR